MKLSVRAYLFVEKRMGNFPVLRVPGALCGLTWWPIHLPPTTSQTLSVFADVKPISSRCEILSHLPIFIQTPLAVLPQVLPGFLCCTHSPPLYRNHPRFQSKSRPDASRKEYAPVHVLSILAPSRFTHHRCGGSVLDTHHTQPRRNAASPNVSLSDINPDVSLS